MIGSYSAIKKLICVISVSHFFKTICIREQGPKNVLDTAEIQITVVNSDKYLTEPHFSGLWH